MARSALAGKVVFITGASAGIGRAIAEEMAQYDAKLILTARREDRLNDIKNQIGRYSANIISSPCDVTKEQDLQTAIELAHEQLGKIDIVVANAAIPMSGKFESLKLEDYRKEFETNVFGLLQTCYTTLEDLKQTKGTLVLIGSVSGYISSPGSSAYAMSKFAIRAFAEAIRSELSVHGIKVVLISPGFVESELRLIDNQGIYHPEQADWVPSFLVMPADKAARQIVKAIIKGKREKFITWHGYFTYWIRQHVPWLYFLLIDRVQKKFRPHRKK